MRQTTFLLSAITLLSLLHPPVALGKPRLILPEVSVTVVDAESGRPAGGVEVALLAKAGSRDNFESLSTATTGVEGRVRFDEASLEKLNRFAVELSWNDAERPPRRVVYELRAKKGEKLDGVRRVRTGDATSYYDLRGEASGDCENLFSMTQKSGRLELTFRRPASYAPCRKTHFKHADVANVGQRNINAGARNLYSFDRDIAMGRDFTSRMGPEQPILDDPVVTQYVVDLVERLGRASDMPVLEYHVQVVDADVLNAFALPGGYVFVYRGLIEATEHESELVGVLAHEIAHVTGRHGTEGVTSAMAKMAGAMLLGGLLAEEVTDNRQAQELIVGATMGGTNLWVMGGTRKREAEADRLGAQYAQRAGYDPSGLATFFDKLAAQREHRGTRLDKFFSDHPPDEVRVANVGEVVDYFLPRRDGLISSSPEYDRVKKRLAAMPPPRIAGEPAANALFSSFKSANEELVWGQFLEYLASGEEIPEGAQE